MPYYDYHCEKCNEDYEAFKSITEYKGDDKCPRCAIQGYRILSTSIYFTGTKIEDAEYNIGLGAITKSKKHREELAKRKNLVEIGNENPDTIHKTFDKEREDRRKKAYEDI